MTARSSGSSVRRVIGALLAAGLMAACGVSPSTPSPAPTSDIASPVDGVVIAVDSAGLGDVRGFTLRPTGDPFAFTFVLGELENPTDFPPSHLAEHLATSTPVRVYFRRLENGQHLVYRLEDAPP